MQWFEPDAVVTWPLVAMIEFPMKDGIRDGFGERIALLSHPVVGALNALVGLHHCSFHGAKPMERFLFSTGLFQIFKVANCDLKSANFPA